MSKFIFRSIVFVFLGFMLAHFADQKRNPPKKQPRKLNYYSPAAGDQVIHWQDTKQPTAEEKEKLNRLRAQLQDQIFTWEIDLAFGEDIDLEGTDLTRQVIYFTRDDFTILVNKKTNRIENIWLGKHPL